MPNPNLQTAARYVREAAREKQRKINDLRQQIHIKEAEIRRDVERIRTAMQQRVSEVTRIQSDPNRSNVEGIAPKRDIENLRRTISDEETTLQKLRQEISQRIHGLEQQISQLNNQARSLEMGD